jgi:hypothetical protein
MMELPGGLARADGISGIVVIGIIYAVLTVIGKIKEASQKGGGTPPAPEKELPRRPPRQPKRVEPRAQRPAARPAPPERASTRSGTQAEASKLEELFRVLGEAAGVPTTEGPMRRPAPLPSAEEVEERETLEVGEDVLNLETGVEERAARQEVDHDDEAEAIVRRRIQAAQARDRTLNRADHVAFDKRIRQVEADKTAVAKRRKVSLREAVVWREILGPPVALRDELGERSVNSEQ